MLHVSICLGNRVFSVSEPRLRNCLPFNLRPSDLTVLQFRRALKTLFVALIEVLSAAPLVTVSEL